MTARTGLNSGALACATLMLLLALPSGASAHTIKGLVHDARDVVLRQVPGTHARISADAGLSEERRPDSRRESNNHPRPVIGFICDLLVRPVDERHCTTPSQGQSRA